MTSRGNGRFFEGWVEGQELVSTVGTVHWHRRNMLLLLEVPLKLCGKTISVD